jgi:hypothetical protein
MMAIVDVAASGIGGGVIPQGFGPPVRTALAAALAKASTEAAARLAATANNEESAPSAVEGAQT